ncbi:hypothetical protein NPIL_684771 [Nephila pilipes]|uniref:Uncharacterized protein n=1 Tax=Nephila pilipes TaxID=299642 RepID=A0A8X6NYN2_NEPPI|nr:hypothetical protein NPIL_684771 [Nephila pilipes]
MVEESRVRATSNLTGNSSTRSIEKENGREKNPKVSIKFDLYGLIKIKRRKSNRLRFALGETNKRLERKTGCWEGQIKNNAPISRPICLDICRLRNQSSNGPPTLDPRWRWSRLLDWLEQGSVRETSADNNMIKMLTPVMYGNFTFDLTDHFSSDIADPRLARLFLFFNSISSGASLLLRSPGKNAAGIYSFPHGVWKTIRDSPIGLMNNGTKISLGGSSLTRLSLSTVLASND